MNADVINLTIDGRQVAVGPGQTVLQAARKIGVDIPTLCYLEKCGSLNSCLVCLVKVKGKLVPSCGLKAEPGMAVESETNEVHEARRTALELLFSDHVGDCLSPCQRLCPLGLNIPVMLRQVQAGTMKDAMVTVRDAVPLPAVLGRLCHHPCEQGCRRANWDDPAAIREVERHVADESLGLGEACAESRAVTDNGGAVRVAVGEDTRSPNNSGKSVVVVGSGPSGLAAAFHLVRRGHGCTVVDRNDLMGGTLRTEVKRRALDETILTAELRQLESLGVQFKTRVALGIDVTLDGLLRGFDAVLLATGEIDKAAVLELGLEAAATGIKSHPQTYQTSKPQVFGAGRATKDLNQLVRAMADGMAAAECIDQFLRSDLVARSGKPFSSLMGRLEKEEVEKFVAGAGKGPRTKACDLCAGFSRKEAKTESSRCLHCDCRASGDCGLQHYAQVYKADASRYRSQRRRFEQQIQPGGVIFERGKCILCGICVKLTEMASEPLGITFIGRGFEVRVAAPFNATIQDGLQKVGKECVENCPTGALSFK